MISAASQQLEGALESSGVSHEMNTHVKRAVITGGNTGMGFESARAFAAKGWQTTLACRSLERAQQARKKIISEFPDARVEVELLDLSDLDSVRAFGKKAQQESQPLDVLLNNAGIMAAPELRTKQGFEMQLATNHLGHFLLTSLLLPLMADPKRPGRVVTVSSAAHLFGKINFGDLQYSKSYSAWGAYGQSKLANILFTYELARRLPSHLTANTLHPGVVATELQRYLIDPNPPWWKAILYLPLYPMKYFLKTPEDGAATQIHLCLSPEVEGVTSEYWVDSKSSKSNAASHNMEVARKLWDVSLELTKADYSFLDA